MVYYQVRVSVCYGTPIHKYLQSITPGAKSIRLIQFHGKTEGKKSVFHRLRSVRIIIFMTDVLTIHTANLHILYLDTAVCYNSLTGSWTLGRPGRYCEGLDWYMFGPFSCNRRRRSLSKCPIRPKRPNYH